jgi:hypothetical protein
MKRRAALTFALFAWPGLATAQPSSDDARRIAIARVAVADLLHLHIEGARPRVLATDCARARRFRRPGGRFSFFPGRASHGSLEGAAGPCWLVHLARPRPVGTEGAVVVLDESDRVLSAWELFSPD